MRAAHHAYCTDIAMHCDCLCSIIAMDIAEIQVGGIYTRNCKIYILFINNKKKSYKIRLRIKYGVLQQIEIIHYFTS